MSGKGGELTDK